jgi:transposase
MRWGLEASGNTWAIATLLASRAGRVVISNPAKTRAIAEAKVTTDKVDAQILAQLLAADYLPAVWLPDAATNALRRQVIGRAGLVRARTRCKNQVHAIGHRNLVPRCPAADLFGHKGRAWLAEQDLPADERRAVAGLLRQLDFTGEELRGIDAELGKAALADDDHGQAVRRLMSIPGVDATLALSVVAAVGEVTRFRSPQKLVAYFGLHPRVRPSGGQPAVHGHITKAGRAHTRGMLVEAAWAAATAPGPLRAFYQRVCGRRGMQIAVVATAGKLTALCWLLAVTGEDYAYAQPSLLAHTQRKLELRAGLPPAAAQGPRPATPARPSARPNDASSSKPNTPTAPSPPPGNPTHPPADADHPGRPKWAWPPPPGRDYSNPQRAQRRGRADSPETLLFATGSTTPTSPRGYPGPPRGQGHALRVACGQP